MLCPECEKDISIGVNFCPYCGASIIEIHQSYVDGIRYFCEGKYAQALRKLKVACLTDPTNKETIKDCGHAYLHSGDLAGALECYDRAEMLGGNFIDIKYNRALLLLNEHRLDEARLLLRSIVDEPVSFKPGQFYLGLIFPEVNHFLSECHTYLGLVLKEKGEYEEAIHHFKKAYELNDEKVSALHNMADLYLQMEKYTSAIETYQELMNLLPTGEELIDIHINLGRAYYGNRQTEEAIGEFYWVLQQDPANPAAIHHLHMIYEKEGILDGARNQKSRVKIVNLAEGASPIFGLTNGDGTEGAQGGDEVNIRIIGKSQGMLRVMRHARLAASSDSTVLLIGENGTGKELIARAIYYNSPRRDKPFVIVNSAAIPETLLESDLFGHEKGSFTGAYTKKIGRFELANEGTIFLDEIGDLSPQLQVKLLRVLQEKEFTHVGGTETIKVDVRIIAATNRDLKKMIQEGTFREDLYYRLNVLPIYIPPLRERKEDIPLLVNFFLNKFSRRTPQKVRRLSDEDMAILKEYHWPGNIRELENMIERAVVMGTNSSLYIEELAKIKRLSQKAKLEIPAPSFPLSAYSAEATAKAGGGDTLSPEQEMTLAEMEREYIRLILTKTGGNQKKAARILGINPSTLWRKIRSYNLSIESLMRKSSTGV